MRAGFGGGGALGATNDTVRFGVLRTAAVVRPSLFALGAGGGELDVTLTARDGAAGTLVAADGSAGVTCESRRRGSSPRAAGEGSGAGTAALAASAREPSSDSLPRSAHAKPTPNRSAAAPVPASAPQNRRLSSTLLREAGETERETEPARLKVA